MDSGYPTREVVKTASPEMLLRAPKDVPWKMGPFRMVSVARSCVTGVALNCCRPGIGIALSVLSWTVANPRRKVGEDSFAAAVGLKHRANMVMVSCLTRLLL